MMNYECNATSAVAITHHFLEVRSGSFASGGTAAAPFDEILEGAADGPVSAARGGIPGRRPRSVPIYPWPCSLQILLKKKLKGCFVYTSSAAAMMPSPFSVGFHRDPDPSPAPASAPVLPLPRLLSLPLLRLRPASRPLFHRLLLRLLLLPGALCGHQELPLLLRGIPSRRGPQQGHRRLRRPPFARRFPLLRQGKELGSDSWACVAMARGEREPSSTLQTRRSGSDVAPPGCLLPAHRPTSWTC